jgi:hypothetical protein
MLLIIILSLIGAILYRAGGMSSAVDSQPTWIPTWLRHGWVRDWIIPIVLCLGMPLICIPEALLDVFIVLLMIILIGLSLSTYWGFLFKKDNFYFHGLFVGFSAIPLVYFEYELYTIIIRAMVLSLSFGLLNKYANKYKLKYRDVVEDTFRGAAIISSLLLLK